MADDTFKPQGGTGSFGQNQIGTGEGEVPLARPSSQNVEMRTMQSDIASMQSSGGGQPRPYVPPPPPSSQPRPQSEPVRPPQPPAPPTPPPRQSTLPKQSPVMPAPKNISQAAPMIQTAPSKKRGMLVGIVVFLVLVALGAIGYFFVYPLFSNQGTPVPEEQTVIPQPQEESQQAETPSESSETPGPLTEHVSPFNSPADITEDLPLSQITLAGLLSGLSFDTAEVPILKELVARNVDGTVVPFHDLITLFIPNVFTPEVTAQFNPDPVFFTYTNEKGTGTGIVATLVSGADSQSIKDRVRLIEATIETKNFFLADPGTPGTEWKAGQTEGIENRYVAFSNPGFSFNYGWFGNTLVLSSSYDGFKEALRRLQ